MNYLKRLVFSLVFFLFIGVTNGYSQELSVGQVKENLISQMEKDGVISNKVAKESLGNYVKKEDYENKINSVNFQNENKSSWTDFFSWINFIKIVAIILLLIAFSGFIKLIINKFWGFISSIPPIIYQALFLTISLIGTIAPQLISSTQSFYILLFCSIANILNLVWIANSYEHIIAPIIKKFALLKLPFETIVSAVLMVYFGFFAIEHQSKLFGFLSVVSLSSMLSFTIKYYPGVMILDFKEKMINSVIFGHLIVILAFAYMLNNSIMLEEIKYFNAGVQFYCTIALGVALIVASSPFYKIEQSLGYIVLFTLIAGLASIGYFFAQMQTSAIIVWIFFALMFIEWGGYIFSKLGGIAFLALSGISLYTLTMFLEKYGQQIYSALKLSLN